MQRWMQGVAVGVSEAKCLGRERVRTFRIYGLIQSLLTCACDMHVTCDMCM